MSRPHEAHGLRYAHGLDGIRALAVFAVVAYHIGTTSNATVLPGGFIGVDIFFARSGYLITSLLVVEAQHGRISIKRLYIRRARRLLPRSSRCCSWLPPSASSGCPSRRPGCAAICWRHSATSPTGG